MFNTVIYRNCKSKFWQVD